MMQWPVIHGTTLQSIVNQWKSDFCVAIKPWAISMCRRSTIVDIVLFVQIFVIAQMQFKNQTKDLHLEQQMLCFYEFKLPRFGRYLLSVYKAKV